MELHRESESHPHVPEEKPELFVAYNMGTTEMETLNWLYATACLIKPENILETGAANGIGTLALASACRDNGFGKVHSVEIDPVLCKKLEALLARHKLTKYAEVHCESSLDYLEKTSAVFGLGFFDSICEIRAEEYGICKRRGLLNGPAVFHDTSAKRCLSFTGAPSAEVHAAYRNKLKAHAADPDVSGSFEHVLSRGMFAIFPNHSL